MPDLRKSPVLLGAASIFDFAGNLRPRHKSVGDPLELAATALESDWVAIGDALRAAIGEYSESAR